MKEDVFTKLEAEVLLCVSREDVEVLISNGELEHSLVSGRVRISQTQIQSFKNTRGF